MVWLQLEASHEERAGCAVRFGSVLRSGGHFFLKEDWDELCFAKENSGSLFHCQVVVVYYMKSLTEKGIFMVKSASAK